MWWPASLHSSLRAETFHKPRGIVLKPLPSDVARTSEGLAILANIRRKAPETVRNEAPSATEMATHLVGSGALPAGPLNSSLQTSCQPPIVSAEAARHKAMENGIDSMNIFSSSYRQFG